MKALVLDALGLAALADGRKDGRRYSTSLLLRVWLNGCLEKGDKETSEWLGRERPELELYISVHREDARAERRYDWRSLDSPKAPKR